MGDQRTKPLNAVLRHTFFVGLVQVVSTKLHFVAPYTFYHLVVMKCVVLVNVWLRNLFLQIATCCATLSVYKRGVFIAHYILRHWNRHCVLHFATISAKIKSTQYRGNIMFQHYFLRILVLCSRYHFSRMCGVVYVAAHHGC